jgi:hypothetical protein
MLRCVALVRTDVSEELSASFNRVTRIGELGTTLAVTSNRRTLRRNASVACYAILHSHRRENLKSYIANVVPSSPILVTLMMEASSSDTSGLTRATRLNIPEDGILWYQCHSHAVLQYVLALHSGCYGLFPIYIHRCLVRISDYKHRDLSLQTSSSKRTRTSFHSASGPVFINHRLTISRYIIWDIHSVVK